MVLGEGSIIIDDYVAAFDVMAEIGSGEVVITDSEATAFNITGTNCTLKTENTKAQRFHSDITNGSINMKNTEASSLTKLNIKESGEVTVELPGAESEYIITAYASKSVTINGKNKGTQYPVEDGGENAEENDEAQESTGTKTLDINVTSGTVNIKTK